MNNNNVKRTKKQDIATLNNIFSQLIGNNYPFEYSKKKGYFVPRTFDAPPLKNEQTVPNTFQISPKGNNSTHKNEEYETELEVFRTRAQFNDVQKSNVLHMAKTIVNRRQWLYITDTAGNRRLIEGYSKGNSRYYKKQVGKILDRTKEFNTKDTDVVFLTLTCDPSKYNSLAQMWQDYKEREIDPIIEPLRKHYGMHYISCMESTAKMRPHIHILCFFPKGKFKELRRLPNNTILKYGKLFNFIKARVNSRVFSVKVVRGKWKMFYLVKYIKKTINNPARNIVAKNFNDITDEDWKFLYEFVFLIVFKKRKVRMSQSKKNRSKSAKTTADASVLDTARNEVAGMSATQLRSYLNSLCINSPLRFQNTVYSASHKYFKRLLKDELEVNNGVSQELHGKITKNLRPIYEEKNFYNLFVQFILNPIGSRLNCPMFNPITREEQGCFTDKYNLDNDEEWLQCVKDILIWYHSQCLGYGLPIRTVMGGKIALHYYKIKELLHKKNNEGYKMFLQEERMLAKAEEDFRIEKQLKPILSILKNKVATSGKSSWGLLSHKIRVKQKQTEFAF